MARHKEHHHSESDALLIAIGLVIAIVAIAWKARDPIVSALFSISENLLLSKLWWLNSLGMNVDTVAAKLAGLTQIQGEDLGYTGAFHVLGTAVTEFSLIVLPAMFALLYFVNHSYRMENRFFRTFEYESLKKEMLNLYPQIKPIINIHPWHTEAERGAYSRSETYWEWAAKHGVIDPAANTPAESRDSFDIKACQKAMMDQMGDLFPPDLSSQYPMKIPASAKIVLAAYCAFFEGEIKQYQQWADESPQWWSEERVETEKGTEIRYQFRVPKSKLAEAEKMIRQAMTNSVTLGRHDRDRLKRLGIPMANRIVHQAVMEHDFIQTVLMRLKSQIPLSSAHEFKWLQSINKNLYYALLSTGSDAWTTRGMTPAIIYRKEYIAAKLNEKVMDDKEFGKPLSVTREELLSGGYNWSNICFHIYKALDQTRWVHHSRYREITPDEEIQLLKTRFSFDNQVIAVTTGVTFKREDGQKEFKATGVRLYDADTLSSITELMNVTERGGLGAVDYKRTKAIISGNLVLALDANVFRSIYEKSNTADRDKPLLHTYNVLTDVIESTGRHFPSWGIFMESHTEETKTKGKKKKQRTLDLANPDEHILLYSLITKEISSIYSLYNAEAA